MSSTLLKLFLLFTFALAPLRSDAAPLVYDGGTRIGEGKHIVFLAGDHEYRSEETLPALARILSEHHGFKCTVLFNVDKKSGEIVPGNSNMPGLEALDSADLAVVFLRFQDLPDDQMQHIVDYLERGGPVVGLRTATHAFKIKAGKKFSKYSWDNKTDEYTGGFGEQVLGQSWVGHYGKNHKQSTRIDVNSEASSNAIVKGVKDAWVHCGGYVGKPTSGDILAYAQPLDSMEPDGKPAADMPPMPSDWTRTYTSGSGKTGRVYTTLYGASEDILNEGYRRLLINGTLWAVGLEKAITPDLNISFVGPYNPTTFRNKGWVKGIKPSQYAKLDSPIPAKAAAPVVAEKKKNDKSKKDGKVKKDAKNSLPPGVLPPMNPKSVAFKVPHGSDKLSIKKDDHIALIGAGMASRMNHFGHFETELFLRNPDQNITIRNMGNEGNTPGFRPHAGRNQDKQYAFPGAKELLPEELQRGSKPSGHFETPDQWLTRIGADTVIAFFGFNSAFGGPDDLDRYKKELAAFLKHTLSQQYNGKNVPQLALVGPTAFQDLSADFSVPDGKVENENIALYTKAMAEVAAEHGVVFVDAFTPSKKWFDETKEPLTNDGAILTEAAYERLAPVLADALFGEAAPAQENRDLVHSAVMEKNRLWLNDFKMPNGVHAFGRRYKPYGPANFPFEIKKTREMTVIRDRAIWSALAGKKYDVAGADKETTVLPPVETNYKPSKKNGNVEYESGAQVQTEITLPEGYEMKLFADEKAFPNLRNPVQLSFDNKGRLWVATMPSYPQYRVGDPLPTDKLLILEDTDNDGVADKETVFAGDLSLPIGFEIAHDGVYVSQHNSLVFLQDTDGDDQYDTSEVLMSGFSDHDTHHAISAFCADPTGAIIMGEGIFLHTSVETSHGTVRGTNGGFYRYAPQTKELRRYAQFNIPNPWGIAFNDFGDDFFLHTSSPRMTWMMPGTINNRYGVNLPAPDLITSNSVRPTSGIEFFSSSHFPDEVQGDILLNNNIGYLGAKQHRLIEDGTGFTTEYVQDLFKSDNPNFRPVDLEFAPDGSLYIADWQNALIGHMQHNARDPLRDHLHGRIYRITYPDRPLVEPAKVDGATIEELMANLALPEYRTRYRTRRELRGRDADAVAAAAAKWAAEQTDDRLKLEALWVTAGSDRVDPSLLTELLASGDHRVRTAATRVAGFNPHKLPNLAEILEGTASDEHGRVRLATIAAASFLRTLKRAQKSSRTSREAKGSINRWRKPSNKSQPASAESEVES